MLVNFLVARCTLKYFSGFMCKLWNQVFCEAQSIALFGCGQLVRTEREREGRVGENTGNEVEDLYY